MTTKTTQNKANIATQTKPIEPNHTHGKTTTKHTTTKKKKQS